jgi:hypothetical protein
VEEAAILNVEELDGHGQVSTALSRLSLVHVRLDGSDFPSQPHPHQPRPSRTERAIPLAVVSSSRTMASSASRASNRRLRLALSLGR